MIYRWFRGLLFVCSVLSAFCFLPQYSGRVYHTHHSKIKGIDEFSVNWKEVHQSFLRTHWHKKPVLIRAAFPELQHERLISPKDIFHLSKRYDFISRMIKNCRSVEFGPQDYDQRNDDIHNNQKDKINKEILANRHWSLLVNDVERLVPSVHNLVENSFHFIPTWRHDDVMISCGSANATIGAHVDSHDVCIIQGSGGNRLWELMIPSSSFSIEKEMKSLIDDERELRVISDQHFKVTHQSVLKPGDLLYIPPRIPHRGKSFAEETSITISIGFRLPLVKDMLQNFVSHALNHDSSHNKKISFMIESLRMKDNIFLNQQNKEKNGYDGTSGFLDKKTINQAKDQVKSMFSTLLNDQEEEDPDDMDNISDGISMFDRWFGSFITTPTRIKSHHKAMDDRIHHQKQKNKEFLMELAETCLLNLMNNSSELKRQLGIKCCYILTNDNKKNNSENVLKKIDKLIKGYLYIDGEEFSFLQNEQLFIQEICTRTKHQQSIPFHLLLSCNQLVDNDHFRLLLGQLLSTGYLFLKMLQ